MTEKWEQNCDGSYEHTPGRLGRSGDTELMAWKTDLDQRIFDAGKGGVYEQTYRG